MPLILLLASLAARPPATVQATRDDADVNGN